MNALYPTVMATFAIGEANYYLATTMRMFFGPYWVIPVGLLGLGQSDSASEDEDE